MMRRVYLISADAIRTACNRRSIGSRKRRIFSFSIQQGHVMQQVFIELYNYRPAWAKCPESERTDFAKKIVEAVKGLKSAGVDVVAYGMNSPETDRRAPYDFFLRLIVCRTSNFSANLRQIAASVGTITRAGECQR